MRITDKVLSGKAHTLALRFPRLRLIPSSGQWAAFRALPDGKPEQITDGMTNKEASIWLDGFHKGADEQEQIFRAKVVQLLRDYLASDDPNYLAAMLSTWLP